MADYTGNVLNSINISNLCAEEQGKLMNISKLQDLIQITQNSQAAKVKEDTKGESNLRREKELTDREKVELEMKKWKKKVLCYLIYL